MANDLDLDNDEWIEKHLETIRMASMFFNSAGTSAELLGITKMYDKRNIYIACEDIFETANHLSDLIKMMMQAYDKCDEGLGALDHTIDELPNIEGQRHDFS